MAESVDDEQICDMDVEVLITLVEERPALWDKTLESYKSKTETTGGWRQICQRLNPVFDQLSEAEKSKYGKTIMKRWINIRDRYTKYLKKVQEQTCTGSKAKTLKKYVYSEQMSFLRKNTILNSTVSSLDVTEEAEQVDIATDNLFDNNDGTAKKTDFLKPPPTKKRHQPKYTEIEKTIIEKLKETDDRHLNFFKGIQPSLQLLRDDEVIQFQSGVLRVIQDIHKTRRPVVPNPQPTNPWTMNYPPTYPPAYQNQVNYNQTPPFNQYPIGTRPTGAGSAPTDFTRSGIISPDNNSSISATSDYSELNFGDP